MAKIQDKMGEDDPLKQDASAHEFIIANKYKYLLI